MACPDVLLGRWIVELESEDVSTRTSERPCKTHRTPLEVMVRRQVDDRGVRCPGNAFFYAVCWKSNGPQAHTEHFLELGLNRIAGSGLGLQ